MLRGFRLYALVVLALLVAVAVLFAVQNSARTTQLSLNLGLVAWQLRQPVAVPALIGASAGGGFALGWLAFGIPAMRHARRARRLETDLAIRASAPMSHPATAAAATGEPAEWR